MRNEWWVAPARPLTVCERFNQAALSVGSASNALKGAHAAVRCYEVLLTRSGWTVGYQWSGWNVAWRGEFEECLAWARRRAQEAPKGSWCRVSLEDGADPETLRRQGYSPRDPETYEAGLPWQNRTVPQGTTRVALVYEAVRNHQQGVPYRLWEEAPNLEAYREAVRAWKKGAGRG